MIRKFKIISSPSLAYDQWFESKFTDDSVTLRKTCWLFKIQMRHSSQASRHLDVCWYECTQWCVVIKTNSKSVFVLLQNQDNHQPNFANIHYSIWFGPIDILSEISILCGSRKMVWSPHQIFHVCCYVLWTNVCNHTLLDLKHAIHPLNWTFELRCNARC